MIVITGDRLIRGKVVCFDKQENVLLWGAYEVMSYEKSFNEMLEKLESQGTPLPEEEVARRRQQSQGRKEMGVVIVPLKHIISLKISKNPPKSRSQMKKVY
eukprot:gene12856-15098_t